MAEISAGTNCGRSRVHHQICGPQLQVPVEGMALASRQLGS
jgi:hypothetical protein